MFHCGSSNWGMSSSAIAFALLILCPRRPVQPVIVWGLSSSSPRAASATVLVHVGEYPERGSSDDMARQSNADSIA